ncbi:MFS transporter [Pseudonocardia humida]|uniref:MFS transporter n=1 Tax=Pseudonocardia humida TaxID=2800819 RepID=A0ABT0ZYZ6_9PSEU|nr:MFS transporter [Pseudonocardia humida]MCO1655941.1 MFS transporter [Pseudonocardia humida]
MTELAGAPPSTPPRGLLAPTLRTLTIGSVALVSLAAFEAMAVATAMPTAAAALDGISGYALAFGLPLATSVVGMVLSGVWSDAHGPAAPMRVGVAAFVIGLLLASTAPTMAALAAGRAVQGLGSGLFSVALYVVVARAVHPALRPRIFAAFAAAWVLPAVVGPPVAGLLVETIGWRWVFALAAVLAVPAATMVEPALRRLRADAVDDGPAPDRTSRPARRVLWALLAAVGAAGLHQAGQLDGALAGVVGAVALVAVALAGPRLLPAGALLARRGLPAVIALRGLCAAAFFGAEAFLPLLLAQQRGLSPTLAGLVLTGAALSWTAGSWLQGRDRAPSRTTMLRGGTAAIAVGVLLTGSALVPVVPLAVAVLGWLVAGLGMGMAYPTLSVLLLELSAPAEQGTNSASLQIADALFSAVVLAVSGAVFAALIGSGAVAFAATTAIAAVVAGLAVLAAGRARA